MINNPTNDIKQVVCNLSLYAQKSTRNKLTAELIRRESVEFLVSMQLNKYSTTQAKKEATNAINLREDLLQRGAIAVLGDNNVFLEKSKNEKLTTCFNPIFKRLCNYRSKDKSGLLLIWRK